jgi:hypothetical protein
VRRSLRQKRASSVLGVQQHPDLTAPTSSTPKDVAAKSSVAPPPGEATSKSTKGEYKQSPASTAELVRQYFVTPRKKTSVPGVDQHHSNGMISPTSVILTAVAATLSAAPPPEAEATSITTKEKRKQAFDSKMEMVRQYSPRQQRASSLPGVQQHPDFTPPTSGILADVAAKSTAAPPVEEAHSNASTRDMQQGRNSKRRKISSSNIHKETIQGGDVHDKQITHVLQPVSSQVVQAAIESASKILAESIDRIHSTKLQIAESKVKSQERLFNTELQYMKKRDRKINRNQKNLISAINGLTNIITTGLKDTASASDAVQREKARGGLDVNIN